MQEGIVLDKLSRQDGQGCRKELSWTNSVMIRSSLLQQTKLSVLLTFLLRNQLSQKQKTKSQSPMCTRKHMHRKTRTSLKKIVFWSKKVKRNLQKADLEKANGPDSIPAKVLKQATPELTKPLPKLVQLCFKQGSHA